MDLQPPITYRHLLSPHPPGPTHPLRVVALCDSDAFYAQCEVVRLRLDPELPLVVLQWDSIIAVNYAARKYGITRMEKIGDARKRCGELKVVHVATYKEGEREPGYWDNVDTMTHKVSLDLYRRESAKIMNIFKAGLPTAEVERASIDEAFIDFTIPIRTAILERFPHLTHVPPDTPEGLDSPLPPPPSIDWSNLGTLVPLEGGDADDEVAQEHEPPATWHDVALSIAAEMMGTVRNEVREKLGYTSSAGLARNKFLAKLVASYRKPNGQALLRNAAILEYLRPMPFQKIRFLGGKLGNALAQEYDVKTVGDLLPISLEEMQRKFGENAIWVWEFLRGIDRTEVKEKPSITKSMLASKNLPKPITKSEDGAHWLRVLAAELALRLTDMRKEGNNIWPKSLVLHVRKGYETSRSRQAPFPFIRNGEVTVDVIASAAQKLWKELVPIKGDLKITSVQLAFSGLESGEDGQRGIEAFLNNGKREKKEGAEQSSRLEYMCDNLAEGDRIGEEEQLAKLLVERNEHHIARDHAGRTGEEGNCNSNREDTEANERASPTKKGKGRANEDDGNNVEWTCSRCKKRLSASGWGDDSKERLVVLRAEHEDFHFAQDLVSAEDGKDNGSPRKRLTIRPDDDRKDLKKRRKGKEKEPKGIAKFFTRNGQ